MSNDSDIKVRVSTDLRRHLQAEADKQDRTLSGLIRHILNAYAEGRK